MPAQARPHSAAGEALSLFTYLYCCSLATRRGLSMLASYQVPAALPFLASNAAPALTSSVHQCPTFSKRYQRDLVPPLKTNYQINRRHTPRWDKTVVGCVASHRGLFG